MTIVDYFDRFASCAKKAKGEPCPKCEITRAILTAVAAHVPDWETYLATMREKTFSSGAEEFGRYLMAAEASIVATIFLSMMATNSGDENDQAVVPEPALWLEAFAGVLSRELGRANIARRVAVIPRLDVAIIVDDPSVTKH